MGVVLDFKLISRCRSITNAEEPVNNINIMESTVLLNISAKELYKLFAYLQEKITDLKQHFSKLFCFYTRLYFQI